MDTLKKKKLNLLLAVLALVCTVFACIFYSASSASASSTITATVTEPTHKREYYALANPQDACISEDYSAIIQGDTSLVIYSSANGYALSSKTFSALKQVKKWGNDGFLISENATIFAVSATNPNSPVQLPNYDHLDGSPQEPINGTIFDLNENYLVTCFSSALHIYSLNGTTVENGTRITESGIATDAKSLTINSNNDIFFVSPTNNFLYRLNASDTSTLTKIAEVAPDKMVANQSYVYYILNSKIYRVSTAANSTPEELTVKVDEGFDLGKLSNPTSISFYNDNILITDSALNAIQEFKVESYDDNGTTKNRLVFTGFAIAQGKTAFNRTDTTVKDVEVYGDNVAVLTDEELFTFKSNVNSYERENYKHFKLGSTALDSFDADLFALGNGTVLLANGTIKQARLLDLNTNELSDSIALTGDMPIVDVTYQSGTYYLVKLDYDNGDIANVYSYSEGADFTLTKILTVRTDYNEGTRIAVDVFKNIYLSATDGKVYCFAFDGTTYSESGVAVSESNATNAIKMSTDLGGNLFVMLPSSLDVYSGNQKTSLTLPAEFTATSFAMNFDNDKVYFISAGSEIIYNSLNATNLSTKNVSIPTEYVLSDEQTDISKFVVYNVKPHANVYSITDGVALFNYNGLFTRDDDAEFLYVCTTTLSANCNMSILIGIADGTEVTVLVNEQDLIVSNNTPKDAETEKAYIATDVNAYYLPIITFENKHVLTRSSETIRLIHGTEIATMKTVTLFNKSFYYASISEGGTPYNAFVPVDFTTLTLSEAEVEDVYTFKSINKTTVYSDQALQTAITELDSGTEIKFYFAKDGVASIAYYDGAQWIKGYVSESSIINPPSNAIRNTLIIISIALAVCGTSIYFILKKKEQ